MKSLQNLRIKRPHTNFYSAYLKYICFFESKIPNNFGVTKISWSF